MFSRCSWMLLLAILIVIADSLATRLIDNVSKAHQVMRPKAKRVQELLMFGNQQNRRTDSIAAAAASSNSYLPNAEKRTLSTSGLEDVKASLAVDESFRHLKQPSNSISDKDEFYGYKKIFSNDMLPRNWNLPSHNPYSIVAEDRRKRSEKSTVTQVPTTTSAPSSSPMPTTDAISGAVTQAKRSNWRSYGNDEYENIEEDIGVMGLDGEVPRNDGGWMAVEPPRHFSTAIHGPKAVPSFDIGIPRTHPVNSYDQYENQYATPYETPQYGGAQYGALYPSQSYYPPEKRFLVARKRSQAYDSYNSRNDLASLSRTMGSQPQVYPNYPYRLIY